jgi:SAM-dependent methyltransferase
MIDEATARAKHQRVENVRFEDGDVTSLVFPDAHFDRVRADRVFQMIPDRTAALAELVRVTKPGGHVVVSNPGGGSEFDVGAPGLTERIASAPPVLAVGGFSGALLPNLIKDAGLEDVRVAPVAHYWSDANASDAVTPLEIVVGNAVRVGSVTAAEGREWLAQVERARERDRFAFVHTIMIVRGTRPG